MNLLERLEVIAADFYTKAMAIRTTMQIIQELNSASEEKKKTKKEKKLHWTQTPKGKRILSRAAKKQKLWLKRGNKDNKRTGKEKS